MADRDELNEVFWNDIPDGTRIRPRGEDSAEARAAARDSRSSSHALLPEVYRLPRRDSAESFSRWWDDAN